MNKEKALAQLADQLGQLLLDQKAISQERTQLAKNHRFITASDDDLKQKASDIFHREKQIEQAIGIIHDLLMAHARGEDILLRRLKMN